MKIEYNRIIDIYSNLTTDNNNFNYNIHQKIGLKTSSIIKSIKTQGKLRTKEGFQEWLVKDEYIEKYFDDPS